MAETKSTENDDEKNPAAVALGRLGGLKGGHARAKKLGKARLSEIGKAMAAARWAKRKALNHLAHQGSRYPDLAA